jgi:hypothetical protein
VLDRTDEQRRAEPAAGLVYRLDTGATGRPAAPFRPDPAWWAGLDQYPGDLKEWSGRGRDTGDRAR